MPARLQRATTFISDTTQGTVGADVAIAHGLATVPVDVSITPWRGATDDDVGPHNAEVKSVDGTNVTITLYGTTLKKSSYVVRASAPHSIV